MSVFWIAVGDQPITSPSTSDPTLGHFAATDAPPSRYSSALRGARWSVRAGALKRFAGVLMIFLSVCLPVESGSPIRPDDRCPKDRPGSPCTAYPTAGRISVLDRCGQPFFHDPFEFDEVLPGGLPFLLRQLRDLGFGLLPDGRCLRLRGDPVGPLGQGRSVLLLCGRWA